MQVIAIHARWSTDLSRTLARSFAVDEDDKDAMPHPGFCDYTSRWRVGERGTVPAEEQGPRAVMEEGHHALSTVSTCESGGSAVL